MEELFALRLAFPWLDGASPRGAACAGAALAVTAAVLFLLPERGRRGFLPLAAAVWCAAGAGPLFAACLLAAAAGFAFVLRADPRPAPRLAAAFAAGALLLAASRAVPGFAGAAAWQFAALVGIRAVSAARDAGREGAQARETLLYFCGGLPASFLGAYHSFASFRASAAAPDAAGARDVAAGAAWLAASAALRAATGPVPPPESLTPAGLWALGAVLLAAEGGMWLGAYRVVEGLSRLSGYAVPRQFDRPWRALSLLDFWRRYSAQNRAYLLKYAFFPLLRRGWAAPAAVAAVFALSAALNALRFAGIFLPGGPAAVLGAATSFALFFAFFGAGCAVESARGIAPADAPAGRVLRRAAVAAAVVWMWTPLSFIAPPDAATPREAVRRWAATAGRMLAPWRGP